MASIFDGKWRSSVVPNGKPKPDEGDFDLTVDDAGKIKPGSKQGNDEVTGEAMQAQGGFHHIKINVPKAMGPPKRKYKGFLLVNGPQLIIVGVANLNPTDFFEGGDFKEGDLFNFFDQQQEVWIATKP